jgi:hypothetical protein
LDTEFGEFGSQPVEVEAQLALGQALAALGLLGERSWLAFSTSAARSRGTTTTPSTSPTMTSPGLTGAPAQTTGTFTEPGVFFTVPCEWMARDHTGKSIAVRSPRRARRRR